MSDYDPKGNTTQEVDGTLYVDMSRQKPITHYCDNHEMIKDSEADGIEYFKCSKCSYGYMTRN